MKRLVNYVLWLNVDTAVGAAITSLFVAKSIGSEIPVIASITLFIAVLAIYNFDHLIDARGKMNPSSSIRRLFYQHKLRPLAIYQLVLLSILLSIIWYLPLDILRAGIVLGLITLIYFFLLFIVFPNRFLLKEMMIAAVFTTALFLAPLYVENAPKVSAHVVLLWLEILLLASANTLLFAWYDFEQDSNEGYASLAKSIGSRKVQQLILGMLFVFAVLILIQINSDGNLMDQAILLTMGVILLLSVFGHKQLRKRELYRITGEFIFLLPLLSLL